jgi:LmbE family N-acetylglucosaminyl deacetylase
VTNLACSLGSADVRERRRAELELACKRLGFDLVIAPQATTAGPSGGMGDEDELTLFVMKNIALFDPQIIVSPSPHDRHPGHEVVARAVRRAIEQMQSRVVWWMYGIWADLPLPTVATKFGADVLETILHSLGAHEGEIARNDYRVMVENRARMNAITGAERLFDFGAKAIDAEFAELCTEVGWRQGDWVLGLPKILDPNQPVGPLSAQSVTAWIHAESVTQLFGRPGSQSSG